MDGRCYTTVAAAPSPLAAFIVEARWRLFFACGQALKCVFKKPTVERLAATRGRNANAWRLILLSAYIDLFTECGVKVDQRWPTLQKQKCFKAPSTHVPVFLHSKKTGVRVLPVQAFTRLPLALAKLPI